MRYVSITDNVILAAVTADEFVTLSKCSGDQF